MNKKKKILLVDDEQDILDLLSYNFNKRGYTVHTAHDGNEALSEMTAFIPDIIVSDILMPNINGIGLCRLLKNDERYKNIPVIFLSAANDDLLVLSSIEAGGARYLSKPIQMEKLFDVVRKIEQAA